MPDGDLRVEILEEADRPVPAGLAGPVRRALDEIQKLTDTEIKKMEEMSAGKEKEVMQV